MFPICSILYHDKETAAQSIMDITLFYTYILVALAFTHSYKIQTDCKLMRILNDERCVSLFILVDCPHTFCLNTCLDGYLDDLNGCPTCKCVDPCQSIACNPGSHCIIQRTRCDTQFDSDCVPSKPMCIPSQGNTGNFSKSICVNESPASHARPHVILLVKRYWFMEQGMALISLSVNPMLSLKLFFYS